MSEFNIYQRMLAIMAELEYIKKRPKAGLPYPYIAHDDVTEAVHGLFIKHRVYVATSVVDSRQEGNRYWGRIRLDWVNADKPEDRCSTFHEGHGVDNQDKGPGKALSYAVKMGVLKGLWLATGERDIEQDQIPYESEITDADYNKAIKLMNEGAVIPFYEFVDHFSDDGKVELWKRFNSKDKTRAREMQTQARAEIFSSGTHEKEVN